MARKMGTPKRYATVAEVAAFTGLSEATVRNLLSTRELTAFRPVSGRIVLDLQEVEGFVRGSVQRQGTRGRKPFGIGVDCESGRKSGPPPLPKRRRKGEVR